MSTSLCVTICTRRRPQMLARCLRSVATQLAEANGAACSDRIFVVENNAAPESEPVVAEIRAAFPGVPVDYALEPTLGIPYARNAALAYAKASDARWIAFVDDDEWLEAGWLLAMRRAAEELEAHVLTGPVLFVYPEKLPLWMRARQTKCIARGAALDSAATNNTLADLDWLRQEAPDLAFDEAMRFTGGSDTDFFHRLHARGGRIRWVEDARVAEDVTAEQCTLSWQLTRTQRVNANIVHMDRKRLGPARAARRHLLHGAQRALLNMLALPFCAVVIPFAPRGGAQICFSRLKKIAAGVGAVRGVLGRAPQPYRSIIGR